MGLQKSYERGKNDFYSYLYNTLSARININGVTGKLIDKKAAFQSKKKNLPVYSKSTNIYFMPGQDGKAAQARLYDSDGRMKLDFDWNHIHVNQNGEVFSKGTVHIQEYKVYREKDPKTKKWCDRFERVKDQKTNDRRGKEKYGPLLKYFNPDIKF